VLLGGRSRWAQAAAVACALAAMLGLRAATAIAQVGRERAALAPYTRRAPEFARAHEARLRARLAPAALAAQLGDGPSLALYVVIAALAWRLPRP
jgi:hypothetical protein